MVHPVDSHVGSRLRHLRKSKKVSQGKLGELLGVSFQQVQKYESGVNRVSASKLFEIGSRLGVDIDYFFDGLPGPSPNERKRLKAAGEADRRRLIQAYQSVPKSKRAQLFEVLDALMKFSASTQADEKDAT